MTAFFNSLFSALAPKVSPRLLDSKYAQKAVNVDLISGELRGLKAPLKISNNLLSKGGLIKSIYRFGQDSADDTQYWFHWNADVNVVRGGIVGDTSELTYFTGDGVPKYTFAPLALTGGGTDYPYGSYNLGVPKPDLQSMSLSVANRGIVSITKNGLLATVTTQAAINITNGKVTIFGATDALYNGDKTITVIDGTRFTYPLSVEPAANASGTLSFNLGGLLETRVYAISYVIGSGQEGAPAIATATVNVTSGQVVTLTNIPTIPAGAYNVVKKRIYRTIGGTNQSTLRYVGELISATTSFIDNKLSSELGENNPALTYEAPPTDMFGLINFSNGMLAAISGNSILISEPYQYHAWPIAGRYSSINKPVAIGAFGQSLAVLTEGMPFVLSGSDPQAMTEDKLAVGLPCLSKYSVVEMLGGVAWACNEGIAFISTSGFDVITKDLITKNEWLKYKPSSMRAYRWQNRYVAFYDNNGVKGGIVFDPATLHLYELDFYASAGFTDPRTGDLYLAQGTNIVKFDAGLPLTYLWRSRVYVSAKLMNPSVAKVVAKKYPVKFKLFADGVERFTKSVLSDKTFALPKGYKATEFEVELSSVNAVKGYAFAESLPELQAIPE